MAEQDVQDISDILETLDNLEHGLMDYESSMKTGVPDDTLIHIIFRYAHNLKSTLAMARKEHSSKLIHWVENNFDLVRGGKAQATEQLMELALQSVDAIKLGLDAGKEDEETLEGITEKLENLKDVGEVAEGADGAAAVWASPLFPEEKANLDKALAAGLQLFQVEKLINAGIAEEQFKNLPIYEDIAEVGALISARPLFKEIRKKTGETVLKLLFATGKTKEELFYIIFDPMRPVVLSHKKNADVPQPPVNPKAAYGLPADMLTRKPSSSPREQLKILIVEDDFITRHLEQSLLLDFGGIEIAVNGKEALRSFEMNLLGGEAYDLILLDIMIPEIDGHETLRRMREIEEERGIFGFDRTKIVVVSSLKDMENINKSFKGQSDSYIIKPVTRQKVERELRRLGLIPEAE